VFVQHPAARGPQARQLRAPGRRHAQEHDPSIVLAALAPQQALLLEPVEDARHRAGVVVHVTAQVRGAARIAFGEVLEHRILHGVEPEGRKLGVEPGKERRPGPPEQVADAEPPFRELRRRGRIGFHGCSATHGILALAAGRRHG
jgi:hypothetical protein